MVKKLQIFCDRCACAVHDWRCVPSKHNVRFYDLTVQCHGEIEHYRIAGNDLIHDRDPRPWYIIAFEGQEAKTDVQYIELPGKTLSIWIGIIPIGWWETANDHVPGSVLPPEKSCRITAPSSWPEM